MHPLLARELHLLARTSGAASLVAEAVIYLIVQLPAATELAPSVLGRQVIEIVRNNLTKFKEKVMYLINELFEIFKIKF